MAPMPERFGGGAIVNFFHTKITYFLRSQSAKAAVFDFFHTTTKQKSHDGHIASILSTRCSISTL
jgi:hypothetical protein